MEVRHFRGKAAQHHGVYLLKPEYEKYMVNEKKRYKKFPESDFDLTVYQKHWNAGKKHYDLENSKTFNNRYLLIGRPQIGKTGVFLHIAYSLWTLCGKPLFTGPLQKRRVIEVEEGEDEDEDEEEEPKETKAKTRLPNLRNLQEYPSYDDLKMLRLEKATVSARYGDPNDQAVRDWYLKEGKTFPYPPFLKRGNTLLKRNHPGGDKKNSKGKIVAEPSNSSELKMLLESVRGSSIPVNNKFCSKPLSVRKDAKSDFKSEYYAYAEDFSDLGTLYVRRHRYKSKWRIRDDKLEMSSTLRLPPIIIPSSGRAETALLDLRETIPEDEDYIQVVVIRYDELSRYARVMNHPDHHIDVFVMNGGPPTIGYARHVAKRLGELITGSSKMDFVFLMDDNISHWSGVTLINDPCNLFGKEPSHLCSQLTDISLFEVLSHFSRDSFKGVEKFSVVGFSNFNRKSIRRKRAAFGRKHVYAAVLLNLKRLKGIDYNQNAWAMEDTDFNLRTDASSGVIVRCMRYVAYKKLLKEGGVVPQGVPPRVQELIDNNPLWVDNVSPTTEHEELKKEVDKYKELLQESNLRLEVERKQKEEAEKKVAFLWKELNRVSALQSKTEPLPSTSSGASGSTSRGSPAISVNRKRSLKEDKNTKEIERRGKARKTNN